MIKRAKELNNQLELVNEYGPTENSVVSTISRNLEVDSKITIGKPIANTKVYILDQENKLLPIGAAGEMCLSSAGLARGYLNWQELTAEKFIMNPFIQGERMYKTGDQVRWTQNGDVEFLGRIDNQIKISGYRIELGEIEDKLLKHETVKEAVVIADTSETSSNKYLCAYLVLEIGLTSPDLREYLSKELPDYMVPSYFIELEKLPLMPNGKIDRKALPKPENNSEKNCVAPRNELEKMIVEVWQEVLGLDNLSITDNFFLIVCQSLSATGIMARLSQELDIDLPILLIFQEPTVAGLAEQIKNDYEDVKIQYLVESDNQKVIKIKPQPNQSHYPVSYAQKRLWVIDKLDKIKTAYNIPMAGILRGNLNREALEQAFKTLVVRHESLRTYFSTIDEEPIQIVAEEYEFKLTFVEQLSTTVQDCVNQEAQTPFDLTMPGLMRAVLVKLNNEEHLFMFTMHHIISDGFSMNIFIKELFQLYTAYNLGQNPSLQPVTLQYRDYAIWQNGDSFKEKLFKQEEYWLSQMSGELPVLDLPTDYPSPLIKSFRGASISFAIDAEVSQKVKEFCKSRNVTHFMTLLATFNILLYKYTGSNDLIVGSPIAGRHHQELEEIIGFFVNTLPWRTQIAAEKSFSELVEEVKEMVLNGFANQDYPFDILVDLLDLKRDMSRSPLFDAMFSWQNMNVSTKPEVQLSDQLGLNIRLLGEEEVTSKFDLTMVLVESHGNLYGSIEYSTDLFKEETIQRMIEHFKVLLNETMVNPEQKLAELNILTPEERDQLLITFNETYTEYPRDKCISKLFEEQVERTPDQVAVKFGSEKLTYQELNEKANQLAHLLVSHGVKSETAVGLILDRSLVMIVGLVATIKAGGVYLPIDPAYPEERITFMLEDGLAPVLVVQTHLKERVPTQYCGQLIEIDQPQCLMEQATDNLDLDVKADNLAYIVYTSGSTGKPKGTLINQKSVVRLVQNTNYIRIKPTDHILQLSSYSFDGSTFDIWGALLNGARLVLIEKERLLTPQELVEILETEKITVLFITTALFNSIADLALQSFKGLRKILFGGERVSVSHVRKVLDFVQPGTLLHVYGPTENTTFTTAYEISELDENAMTVSIGKPIANTQVYILDQNLNPVSVGKKGELYTSGDGLARGYLNRPELTAERFIPNPFVPGELMYKTGDIVKYLPDGNIIFVDRADQQVKIRGFRIELGEIEGVLIKHPMISEAVVMAKEDVGRSKYLVAYIISERELANNEVRGYLLEKLPEYMVPAVFVPMALFPLNKNGKVDHKALPDPTELVYQNVDYLAPRNEKEEIISKIWGEVLMVKKVGVNDSFFEMGGDSLKAIQVVARMNSEGIKSHVSDIFRYQTLEEVARFASIKEDQVNTEQGIISGEMLPIPVIRWFFGNNFAEEHHFNQSIYVKVPKEIDPEILERAFHKLIEHHDGLRLNYKPETQTLIYGNRYFEEGFKLTQEDLSMYSKEEQAIELEKLGTELKSSFNLENDLLIKAALFKFSAEEFRLLITIHHLIVDGMSWRIIMEDLSEAYLQLARHGEVTLPVKSASFKAWAEQVTQYSQSEELKEEIMYWQEVLQSQYPLPIQNAEKFDSFADTMQISSLLSVKETKLLLTEATKAYNTEINDLLLTALALTLSDWTGRPENIISLEGHGREEIFDDIEVYRTVGWFTTIFPVKLDLDDKKNISDQIKAIKEQLHNIPNKGFGYGVLKYVTQVPLPEIDERCKITFNYLGQFDDGGNGNGEKTKKIFDDVPANTGY